MLQTLNAASSQNREGVAKTESKQRGATRNLCFLSPPTPFVVQRKDLTFIPLTFEERTGHLPSLLHDVVARLRLDAGTKAPISDAPSVHGDCWQTVGFMQMRLVFLCRRCSHPNQSHSLHLVSRGSEQGMATSPVNYQRSATEWTNGRPIVPTLGTFTQDGVCAD
jgi:hypothetical protein